MAQGWQPLVTLIWVNKPNTTTPLNATNLNDKVSSLIGELDGRTRTLDSVKLDVNDATGYVNRCETAASDSEAYAIGERGGVPVTSGDPAYHNNSKYHSEQSGDEALRAEGYANGEQGGIPVGSGSPYYHNNAKYFKDQASQIAAQQLGALTDVDITSPQNGQVLTYDSNESKWVNGASGGTNLDDLNDVSISTPTDGQVLTYDSNAGEWVNGAGGGGSSTLAGLTDVTITTPQDGQVLKYDSNLGEWVNGTGGGIPSGWIMTGRVEVSISETATFGTVYTDVANAAVAAFGALANDEALELELAEINYIGYLAQESGKIYKNTDSAFQSPFQRVTVTGTQIEMITLTMSSTQANSKHYYSKITATPAVTITDYTNVSSATLAKLYFRKLKQV